MQGGGGGVVVVVLSGCVRGEDLDLGGAEVGLSLEGVVG